MPPPTGGALWLCELHQWHTMDQTTLLQQLVVVVEEQEVWEQA